jgi:hypothetical protein
MLQVGATGINQPTNLREILHVDTFPESYIELWIFSGSDKHHMLFSVFVCVNYFTTQAAARLPSVEWWDDIWMLNSKGFFKEVVMVQSLHYPGTCLKGLKIGSRTWIAGHQVPRQKFEWSLPECERGVLPLCQPARSYRVLLAPVTGRCHGICYKCQGSSCCIRTYNKKTQKC